MAIFLEIDRKRKDSLSRQICEQLRAKILAGDLRQRERLPSSRDLARALGVARNTVIEVYEQLVAEGYLHSRTGAGTFVTEGSRLEIFDNSRIERKPQPAAHETEKNDIIDFIPGIPDLGVFPRKEWHQMTKRALFDSPDSNFNYPPASGLTRLKHELVTFLAKTKGIHCDFNQVIITAGSAQGIMIAMKILQGSKRSILVEDPVYSGIQSIARELGIRMIPIPVDAKGIKTATLPLKCPAECVLVTPSHQYPMGSVLPVQRRIELIKYSRKHQLMIIENDYDSEFRHHSSPIPSLQLLDQKSVVHIGTFSESLFPALRIGYMVVPRSLVTSCTTVINRLGLAVPFLSQLTLAWFIQEGSMERHLWRMKKLYAAKRALLISKLKETFHDRAIVQGDATGLYIVVEFTEQFSPAVFDKQCQEAGVKVYPVEDHAITKGKHKKKMILGYGSLSREEIRWGIQRLNGALLLSSV